MNDTEHKPVPQTTRGKRCVRIIHGKDNSPEGKLPMLKGKVNS